MAIGEDAWWDDETDLASALASARAPAAIDCAGVEVAAALGTAITGDAGASTGAGGSGGGRGGGVKVWVDKGLRWINGVKRPNPNLETSVRFFCSGGSSGDVVVGEGGVTVGEGAVWFLRVLMDVAEE